MESALQFSISSWRPRSIRRSSIEQIRGLPSSCISVAAAERRQPAGDFAPEHRGEQAALVAVLPINGGLADPGGLGHRIDRGRVEAAFEEQAGGDLDQPLVALDRGIPGRPAAA